MLKLKINTHWELEFAYLIGVDSACNLVNSGKKGARPFTDIGCSFSTDWL